DATTAFLLWPAKALPQTLDHNTYFNTVAPPRWQRDGVTYQTFTAYQQAAGEAHSRYEDPRLVGAAEGSASDSPFPVRVSPNGRHLVDAGGKPFLLHGDTAWSLIVQLTKEETEEYLENRRQKGFNAILVNLIEYFY